jgi:membrane protease YdiL (CAAX protease family)
LETNVGKSSFVERFQEIYELKKESNRLGVALILHMVLAYIFTILGFQGHVGAFCAIGCGLTIVAVFYFLLPHYNVRIIVTISANVLFIMAVYALIFKPPHISFVIIAMLILMSVLYLSDLRFLQIRFSIIASILLILSLYFLFFDHMNIDWLTSLKLFDPSKKEEGWAGFDPVYCLAGMTLISIFALVFPFLFFLKRSKSSDQEIIKFNYIKPKLLLSCIAAGMLVNTFANIVSGMLTKGLNSLGVYYDSPKFPEGGYSLTAIIFGIISMAIDPAIIEEFAFRGVILGRLRKFGEPFAIFVSAALFGLFHCNLCQIPHAFIKGLFMGFLVVKMNSMLPAMLLHFLNNLQIEISGVVLNFYGEQAAITFGTILFLLEVILGSIGLRYLWKERSSLFGSKDSCSKISTRVCIMKSFSSIGMAIAILIFIVITLRTIKII